MSNTAEDKQPGRAILSRQLWFRILIGLALGLATGLVLSPAGLALVQQEIAFALGSWIALPGVLFLGLITMVIIPLVITSIVLGISGSGDVGFLRRISLRIVPYFLITTSVAITFGVLLAGLIQPGTYIDAGMVTAVMEGAEAAPARTFEDLTIPQRLANLIPTNFTQAALNRDLLQIVIAAIILGVVVLTLPRKTVQPFIDLCMAGQAITMKVIDWAMAIAPLAVFGLIADITIRIGFDAIFGVGMYMATVLAGLFGVLVFYMLVVTLVAGRSPLGFLRGVKEVQLLAFSTSSSAAVMPFSIQAAEEKLHVREDVARFVIPLGATINMDGTALYQAVAAIFLCQVFGIDLSTPEIILLIITTVGASIGTPATPGVGIVVLATILTGIGVPPAGVGLILGVDRILDMCRTTINVTGDLTAATVMQRWLHPTDRAGRAGQVAQA